MRAAAWATVATPPTSGRRLIGTIVDIDRFVVTIETDAAMHIAVDLEDCQPAPT